MADRSGLIGSTYALPQVAGPAPTNTEPYNDGVEPLQGLQYIQGVTDQYYQKVAALKAFMQDTHANFGVDVRVPDLSRPESIKLNQIYQTALADILSQGNLLKNSQQEKTLNTQMNLQYAPGVDTAKTPVASMSQGQDVYTRQAEPTVMEVNNKTQMSSQTQEEHDQKTAVYEAGLKHYDEMIAKDPARKSYYEYQKSILTAPTKGEFRPYNPYSYQDRSFGRKVQASGNWLKKITNLKEGAHDSFQPDAKQLTDEGHPYLISKELHGKKIGNAFVDYWRFNPDTHQTEIFFNDGTKVDASSQDPQTLTVQLSGLPPEAIDEYANKRGMVDEYGQVDKYHKDLLGKDADKLIDRNISASKAMSLTTGPAVEELDNELAKMDWHLVNNDELDAGKFKIERQKSNYVIKNFLQAIPPANYAKKEYDQLAKSYSKFPATEEGRQALVKFLIKNGAHVEQYKIRHKGKTELEKAGGVQQPISTQTGTQAQSDADARTKALKEKYGVK